MNKREIDSRLYGVTPESDAKTTLSPRLSLEKAGVSLSAGSDGPAGRGVGGTAMSNARRGGTARGPLVNVKRVKNLGRGVWGFGEVVGWIPADVTPWIFCRRMGWRQIFSRYTKPLMRTRPYVLGDDGRNHLPEKWEVVE